MNKTSSERGLESGGTASSCPEHVLSHHLHHQDGGSGKGGVLRQEAEHPRKDWSTHCFPVSFLYNLTLLKSKTSIKMHSFTQPIFINYQLYASHQKITIKTGDRAFSRSVLFKYNLHTVKFTLLGVQLYELHKCISYDHHHNQDRVFLSPHEVLLCPFVVKPSPPLATTNLIFVPIVLPFPKSNKWNHTVCSFCGWLFSLSIMLWRFIHIVACIRYSFFLITN